MTSNSAAIALLAGVVMILIYFRRAILTVVMTLVGLGLLVAIGYVVSIYTDGLTGFITSVLLFFVSLRYGADSREPQASGTHYDGYDDEMEYQQRRREEQHFEDDTRIRQFHNDAISRNR